MAGNGHSDLPLAIAWFRGAAPFSAGCQVKHSRVFETMPVFQASFHSENYNQQVRNHANDLVAATSMTKLLSSSNRAPFVVVAHFRQA